MTDFLSGLERDLVDAAARAVAVPHREKRRRPLRRLPALALVLLAVLALAAVAFAAQRIIVGTGAPVPQLSGPPSHPHSGWGLLVPDSARMLPVRAADPDGGPPWGARAISTTRGVGCIQIGRIVGGRIGVLGADGAFGDDRLFHPFPRPSQQDLLGCLTLDADGRLFLNVSAMGIPASASTLSAYTVTLRRPAVGGRSVWLPRRHAG